MAKKKVKTSTKKSKKKTKLRFKRVLLAFLFLFLLAYLGKFIWELPIKNIYINNNQYLQEQEIIELLKIQNYPSFLGTSSIRMKDNLKKDHLVKDVKIKKRFWGQLYIEVIEYKALFINKNNSKVILENKKEIDKDLNLPILVNYVPDTVYDDFIEGMIKINREIINRISEIEYKPNHVDTKRFLVAMTDGNYVYINTFNFANINKYLEIIKTVGCNKGILYLDTYLEANATGYFSITEPCDS